MSKELNLEQVTPQEYRQWLKAEVKAGRLPKSELELIHVREEKKQFDNRNFAIHTMCVLQKYNVREWGVDPSEKQWDYYERMRTSGSGYEYTILYNPREKEVEEKVEEPTEEETTAPAEKKPRGKKAEKETISLGE